MRCLVEVPSAAPTRLSTWKFQRGSRVGLENIGERQLHAPRVGGTEPDAVVTAQQRRDAEALHDAVVEERSRSGGERGVIDEDLARSHADRRRGGKPAVGRVADRRRAGGVSKRDAQPRTLEVQRRNVVVRRIGQRGGADVGANFAENGIEGAGIVLAHGRALHAKAAEAVVRDVRRACDRAGERYKSHAADLQCVIDGHRAAQSERAYALIGLNARRAPQRDDAVERHAVRSQEEAERAVVAEAVAVDRDQFRRVGDGARSECVGPEGERTSGVDDRAVAGRDGAEHRTVVYQRNIENHAGVDRRDARVGIGGAKDQQAVAVFGDAAGAADDSRERQDSFIHVDGQRSGAGQRNVGADRVGTEAELVERRRGSTVERERAAGA